MDERSLFLEYIELKSKFCVNSLLEEDKIEIYEKIHRIIELNPILSLKEMELIYNIYKHEIIFLRENIKKITIFYLNNNFSEKENVLNLIKSIEKEFINKIIEIINVFEKRVLPNIINSINRFFCFKILADFSRYISNFFNDGIDFDFFSKKSKNYYEEALNMKKEDISYHSLLYLGIVLNYSIFLYDTLGMHYESISFIENFLKNQIEFKDYIKDDEINDYYFILKKLNDNLFNWK